jgi:hypothetical protein
MVSSIVEPLSLGGQTTPSTSIAQTEEITDAGLWGAQCIDIMSLGIVIFIVDGVEGA